MTLARDRKTADRLVDDPTTMAASQLAVAEIRARLQAPEEGLSSSEAATRLQQLGSNSLPQARGRSWWQRLWAQISNLLILVLLSAVVITALLGHTLDSVVILAVVISQALIGLVQEGRAEQALAAIRHMLAPAASVIRDGHGQRIAAADLVPGDTVLLEPGDRVPADIRLERCHSLSLDEAILTGESLAVEKQPGALAAASALGDQTNMAFSGTLVVRGTGRGVVVATGSRSEIGRISGLLQQTTGLQTPTGTDGSLCAADGDAGAGRWLTDSAAWPLAQRAAICRFIYCRCRSDGGGYSGRVTRHSVDYPGRGGAAYGQTSGSGAAHAGDRNHWCGVGDLLG